MKKIFIIGLGLVSLLGLVSCNGKSEVAGVYGFVSSEQKLHGKKYVVKCGKTYYGSKITKDNIKLTLFENQKMQYETKSGILLIGTWSEENNEITLNYDGFGAEEGIPNFTKNGNKLNYHFENEDNSYTYTLNLKRLSDSPDKGVENYHYHSFNKEINYNDESHWYDYSCGHKLFNISESHVWKNDSCVECHRSVFNFQLNSDSTYQVEKLLDKDYYPHTIPETFEGLKVTSINASGFDNTQVKELTFGTNVKKIVGEFNVSSLENIYYNGTLDDWFNIEFENSKANPLIKSNHFYIKNNEKYELIEVLTIPENVTEIKENQYYCFKDLKKVTLSNKTSIGLNAFYGCEKLTDIYFNGTKDEYLEKIGDTNIGIDKTKTTIHVYENGSWINLN